MQTLVPFPVCSPLTFYLLADTGKSNKLSGYQTSRRIMGGLHEAMLLYQEQE